MRTETVSLTICADFTIWLSISVGFRGPFSQNEHGPRSAAKAKERSQQTNTRQSSLQKRMQSIGRTTKFFTRQALLKRMQPISQRRILTGRMACSFTDAKN